jgi:hypothetical protein
VTSVALALVVWASVGAQGSRGVVTPGVSHIWRTVDGTVVRVEDLAYYRLIHSVFELRGDKGGEKAYLSISWRERRFATRRAAMCGGLRYFGRYVIDSRGKAGEGWFGLEDRFGTMHLKITRRLSVFKTAGLVGPPLCVETWGTWSGETGVVNGYDGTFYFNHDDTLTLR